MEYVCPHAHKDYLNYANYLFHAGIKIGDTLITKHGLPYVLQGSYSEGRVCGLSFICCDKEIEIDHKDMPLTFDLFDLIINKQRDKIDDLISDQNSVTFIVSACVDILAKNGIDFIDLNPCSSLAYIEGAIRNYWAKQQKAVVDRLIKEDATKQITTPT